MSIADYNDGKVLIEADYGSKDFFKISPSSMEDFFSSTTKWYRENLLGEQNFIGSSATVLGTAVHWLTEQASLGTTVEDPEAIVEEFLDHSALTIPDLDKDLVRSLWRDMSDTLIEGCVTGKEVFSTEEFSFSKLLDGIYIGGTFDALILTRGNPKYYVAAWNLPEWKETNREEYLEHKAAGNKVKVDTTGCEFQIRDYKTASSKPRGWSYKYKLQALCYAYMLSKQKGYCITSICLEFVTRPTKTLPCRHFTFEHTVTLEDLEFIESLLMLIAHSVKTWKEQPELRYLLAQDYRMKLRDKPKLFKKE